jgi:hypothetical protein
LNLRKFSVISEDKNRLFKVKAGKSQIPGQQFVSAANDYKLLLEKGYPQKSVLILVGNRYKLSAVERSVLYRGISPQAEADARTSKLVQPEEARHQELYIDGYNVLFTIGSYLSGNLVFISNDNLLRDSSEIHGKIFREKLMDHSILLLFSYLSGLETVGLHFYFDEPVSHSGELCFKVERLLEHYMISGTASTNKSPDYLLKTIDNGLIATSDSGVIDRCKVGVVDLPKKVITSNFKKEILDVNNFLYP